MTKQYLHSLIRNIRKDIYQSGLNIFGLTIGCAAIIFIAAYINHEINFDTFHSKADRIYRIVADVKIGETEVINTDSENPIALAVKNDLPEVEEATRIYFKRNQGLKAGDNNIIEEKLFYADKNIFDIFDFELSEGDKRTALAQPNSIVVTKAFGNKYFGNAPLIGKTIDVGNSGNSYTITGVLKEVPKNSHLRFEELASYNSLPEFNRTGSRDWGNFMGIYTYILLKKNTDFKNLEAKFSELPAHYYASMMKDNLGITLAEFESQGNFVKHLLQPLKEIHLDKTYIDNVFQYGNKQMLYILGAIGLLIIIVACFNFINLSTARASLKAKEIGMKKILGSSKRAILVQVLSETFLQSLFALSLSAVILLFVLPLLNSLTGVTLSSTDFIKLPVVSIFILLPFAISIIAGLFPAVIISKYDPIEVIREKHHNMGSHSLFRNMLVSTQFIVFIVLIAGTITIGKQLYFLRNHQSGFNKENVLVIENGEKIGQSSGVLKNELIKFPDVTDASLASDVPSRFEGGSTTFSKPNDDRKILINKIYADGDFFNTLKIKLSDGRFLTNNINEETDNAVINRKAAELLGWIDSKNKVIFDYDNGGKNFNVVGIVEDFHLGSLKFEQLPVIIRIADRARFLVLRVRAGSERSVVDLAKTKWEKLNPNVPFEYFFLDNSFNAQYKSEERLSKLVSLFSTVSAIIACMGLLGLVSFASVRRRKEIGIRKVNGAKISEVMAMLNKDFVFWVAIAFVIATPIAYYAMHKWLENFAYKTTLSWWIFALAGILALGIAILTVSWQSWKAATRNPVEALRYE